MIYLLAILLLLIFIGSIIVNKKDLTAPSVIFSSGFVFQILWALFYQKTWSLNIHVNTFLVLFLGVFEFFIVTMIIKFIANKINPIKNDEQSYEIKKIKTNTILEYIYFAFSIIVMTGYLYYLVRAVNGSFGSIKSIIDSITKYDSYMKFTDDFSYNSIPFIIKNLNLAVIYSGYWFSYVIINNYFSDKKIKKVQVLIFALSLVSGLISGSRTPVFLIIVADICYFLVLLFKKKNYKNLLTKKLFIYLVIIGLVFVGLFFPAAKLLGRKTNSNPMDYLSIYCGAEVKNLDIFLQEKDNIKKNPIFGSQTFYNVIQFASDKLHVKGLPKYRLDLPFKEVNGINLGNVYTTFYAYIYDFGYVGPVIFIFIMAAICASIYEYIIRIKKVDKVRFSILIYGAFYGCLLLSFFSDIFFEELLSPVFIKKIIVWIGCTLVFCKLSFGLNKKEQK